MASEIRCKSPVVPNFFCRIFRVAAMNGKVKFNGEETKQHDGKWCYLFVSSKQFQQAMTALSTYLWHSAQPRDSCYAHRRVRDTPWMWRLQFQSSNHSSRTSKLSTSMRFRKKGREIIHWHKSFTDLFFSPWAASVKWNTNVATIKYLRNRLYNPLVFPKCRELETLLTDPLWNLLRSWASLGAGPGW